MEKVSRERWPDSADRRHVGRVASLTRWHLSKALKTIPCVLYFVCNICSSSTLGHKGRSLTSAWELQNFLFLKEGLFTVRETESVIIVCLGFGVENMALDPCSVPITAAVKIYLIC